MTEHRDVGTVLGYFQAGALLESRASLLFKGAALPTETAGPVAQDETAKVQTSQMGTRQEE